MMCYDIVFKRPLFVSIKTASSLNNVLKKTQRAMNNTNFLLFFKMYSQRIQRALAHAVRLKKFDNLSCMCWAQIDHSE